MTSTNRGRTYQEWLDQQKRLYGIEAEEEGFQLEVGPDEVFKPNRKKKIAQWR